MKTKRTTRTTEIIVERDEFRVISRIGQGRAWCAQCEREVQVMTPSDAMAFVGPDWRAVSDWVDCAGAHFVGTATGSLLICVNSL